MKNKIVSTEVVGGILTECFRVEGNVETGGVLVGPKSHPNIITDIIPSGESAQRGYATYFQSPDDVNKINRALSEYQKAGFDFKGYFHKHPRGIKSLSAGDLSTCREILTEPNYRINNRLIMIIVSATYSQDFPIFIYEVSLESQNIIVEETGITTLPKSCILECMQCFEPIERRDHEDTIDGYNSRKSEREDEFQFIRDRDILEINYKFSNPKKRIKKNSILLRKPRRHTRKRIPYLISKKYRLHMY